MKERWESFHTQKMRSIDLAFDEKIIQQKVDLRPVVLTGIPKVKYTAKSVKTGHQRILIFVSLIQITDNPLEHYDIYVMTFQWEQK